MKVNSKLLWRVQQGESLTVWVSQDPRNTELAGEHPFKDLLVPPWARKGARAEWGRRLLKVVLQVGAKLRLAATSPSGHFSTATRV